MLLTPRIIGRQTSVLNKSIWKDATLINLLDVSAKQRKAELKRKEELKRSEEKRPQMDVKKQLPTSKAGSENEDNFAPFRYVYPEFLPDPRIDWRNRIREKLERIDMLKRRSNLDIPEFYVGSIMKVAVSDVNAPGKVNTFVGICTERGGSGLRAYFVLRNAVDGQGVEIMYEMYNPTIQTITVLRLEKRLDENLRYLRDCPIEHSTFPFDMPQEVRSADAPVPVNPLKVKLKPKPWCAKWHLWDLRGVEDFADQLEPWQLKKFDIYKNINNVEHNKYDLMKTYRSTIPSEEQSEIFGEVHQQLAKLTQTLRSQKRKRVFAKPQKQA